MVKPRSTLRFSTAAYAAGALLCWLIVGAPGTTFAEIEFPELDREVRALKEEVIAINRDLLILEEEMLFPASTRLAVYLSLEIGDLFELDSVQLRLNDQIVTHHLYDARELDALRRGGVQRLYLGNITGGPHEMTARFIGRGPQGRPYRRATTITFEKDEAPKHLELRITDSEQRRQPQFDVVEWESAQ